MCLGTRRWRPDLFAKRTGSPPEAEAGDARQRPPTSRIRDVHLSCTSGDSRARFRNCRPIDVSRPRCQKRRADPVQCEPDDGGSSLGIDAWWGGGPSRTRPLTMRKTRIAAAVVSCMGLAAVGLGQTGCFSEGGFRASHVTRIFSPRPVAENPLVVPSTDFDTVWNKTVAVVDKYFDIASENRLSRTIVTQPMIGATLLEPWRPDSVSFTDRLESTLQRCAGSRSSRSSRLRAADTW